MNLQEKSAIIASDAAFENVLKQSVQGHSSIHWTPVEVIKLAVQWLGREADNSILDIGSGVGKFCLVGAMNSDAHFTGVETRRNLSEQAKIFKDEFNLSNVEFIHSDIIDIDFSQFTSFYYYNPFCEHIALSDWIDDQIEFNEEAFYRYQDYVEEQLKKMPTGTKLVKYCSPHFDISTDFDLMDMDFNGELQLWTKH